MGNSYNVRGWELPEKKSNIDNYEKTYKKLLKSVIKKLKKVKYITKELDTHDKIKLCREYNKFNINEIEYIIQNINKYIEYDKYSYLYKSRKTSHTF